jgi:hypothetical protein
VASVASVLDAMIKSFYPATMTRFPIFVLKSTSLAGTFLGGVERVMLWLGRIFHPKHDVELLIQRRRVGVDLGPWWCTTNKPANVAANEKREVLPA